MKRILSAVGLSILASMMISSANAEKVYYVRNGPGGKIAEHYYKYTRVAQEYDRVEIVGMCKSACTMLLGLVSLNRICIRPTGYFMFHAAHGPNRVKSDSLTAAMIQHYPPPVMAWVKKHRAVENVDPYTYLYAKDVTFIRHCSASKPPAGKTPIGMSR